MLWQDGEEDLVRARSLGEERAERLGKRGLHRVIVDLLPDHRLAIDDELAAVGRVKGLVQRELSGVDHVVCGHGRAIVEDDIVPQLERVDRAVLGDLPGLGQVRDRVHFLIKPNQTVIEPDAVVRQQRVEVVWHRGARAIHDQDAALVVLRRTNQGHRGDARKPPGRREQACASNTQLDQPTPGDVSSGCRHFDLLRLSTN